jgi:hypothetical protein
MEKKRDRRRGKTAVPPPPSQKRPTDWQKRIVQIHYRLIENPAWELDN